MSELYMQYEKNNQLYKLETYNDLVKITRNNKVIHIQFERMATHDDLVQMGFKNLNDIVGDFSSYIDFCENNQYYNEISFKDDEWSKHTKIYAEILYKDANNEYFGIKRHIESVQGSMANSRTDRVLSKYYDFIRNSKEELENSEIEKKIEIQTREQLLEYLNRHSGRTITMYN